MIDIQFSTRIPPGGFDWADYDSLWIEPKDVLVDRTKSLPSLHRRTGRIIPYLVGASREFVDIEHWRTVRPFELPRNQPLFEIFAGLGDQVTIKRFANKYGALGVSVKQFASNGYVEDGTSLQDWLKQINEMRALLSGVAGRKPDLVRAGAIKISKQLHEVSLGFARSMGGRKHSRLFFQPTTLLSAMWLELALYVDAGWSAIKCESCGKLEMVDTTDGRRKYKRVCGATCRQRLKRQKKAKAGETR